ncbi:MAG: TldD/PmbA family protein [Acidobacteriota bacterium]
MLESTAQAFREAAAGVDYATLRVVEQTDEVVNVRQGILQPVGSTEDRGAMVEVHHGDGSGYAATSDLSPSGLRSAIERAKDWAETTAGRGVVKPSEIARLTTEAEYDTPVQRPWEDTSLGDKIDLVTREAATLKTDDRIVDWSASLWYTGQESTLISTDGGQVRQRFSMVAPNLHATANSGTETQTRTLGGHAQARQGGLEIVEMSGFVGSGGQIADEALQLLEAPDCPSGVMDLVLAPDQMVLQIHESIGHPLELDRILGDERNYAGTSFVTMDMFGSYQYGSERLNVTFDPTRPDQLASYGYDDDGQKATKEFLIKDGLLLRPLGGATSQARADMKGVANARANGWNRPPIDRMANINLEHGDASFEDMIKSVEKGVYMETNCSWSIDDSRNKFQFGCELGRLIENGELGPIVRKANYRGISATFWRSLSMVGNESTVDVMGTPYCGKGEPNQVIKVGHASPTCLFRQVDVFGGA